MQRADGQSEDPAMLRLHCVDTPRPEGNNEQFNYISLGGGGEKLHNDCKIIIHELLLSVWSLRECSS